MHDAARRKLGWIIGQWCHAETVVCRPLWLNKFTLLMMKPFGEKCLWPMDPRCIACILNAEIANMKSL
jgi:hypothetical protein